MSNDRNIVNALSMKYSTDPWEKILYLETIAKSLSRILGYTFESPEHIPDRMTLIFLLQNSMKNFIKTNQLTAEAAIYNGRDPDARIVADWWDTEKENDEIIESVRLEQTTKKQRKEDRKQLKEAGML
jgi:endonuclease III-like uncharacterized protein